MDTPRPVPRSVGLGLLSVLAGLLFVLLAPASPAAAHATLVSSDPANGAIVSTAPSQVLLTFSEPVRLVPGRIQVVGPDGTRVDTGEPSVSGTVVIIPVGDAGPRGSYLVSYRVISADSHPVAGGITFAVGAPSATPPTPVEQGAGDTGARVAVGVAKYVSYAGLVLVIGPVVLLAALWPQRLSRRGPARLVWLGLGLVAAATVAGLWLQVPYTTGSGLFEVTTADVGAVLGSGYGAAYIVRLGILTSALLLLRPLLSGAGTRTDAVLLGVLGFAGLATWPMTGHPAASPVSLVSIAVDLVHLASAAFWVGGLVLLAGFLLSRAEPEELGVILPTWSRWAAAAVAALLLSGVVQGLIEVASVPALVGTAYGRLLLVKLGLVVAVIAVAAYSRHLVRTRLGPHRPGAMRIAVIAEAALLAVVLGISATLVQTTPARTAIVEEPMVFSDRFATIVETSIYSLQVDVYPAALGNNTLHLYVYDLDGAPLSVAEWRATAALPAAGVEPVDIPVLGITDNHAVGEMSLTVPGDWELLLTIRISEIDQESASVVLPIG